MNERIQELAEEAGMRHPVMGEASFARFDYRKFAELIIKECAEELRDAEREADRAYKAKEVKERMVFDGNDLAELLEERFLL